MANDSTKIINTARILAIAHIIVGFLVVSFGIADRVVEYFWTGNGCHGIWMGVWMCVTGILGIRGTCKEPSVSRNSPVGVFMGFSITCAVYGGILTILYSIAIALYQDENYDSGRKHNRTNSNYEAQMAVAAIMLVLGVVEFAIGIWTVVYVRRLMRTKTCCFSTCTPPPQIPEKT
ncbi:hypothetical protein ACROYT_G013587 [Oculina patagonica]